MNTSSISAQRLEREKRILQQARTVVAADEEMVLKSSELAWRTAHTLVGETNSDRRPFRYEPPAAGRRGVKFVGEVQVYSVESHVGYTEEERYGSWYSPRELERSAGDVRKTIRYMRNKAKSRQCRDASDAAGGANSDGIIPPTREDAEEEEEEPEGICTRGFEHLKSPAHTEQRRINRDCAVRGLFDEQELQRRAARRAAFECDGAGGPRHRLLLLDDERLRRASERGTEWAKNHARRLGMEDERAARKIADEDHHRRRMALVGVADAALASLVGDFCSGGAPSDLELHPSLGGSPVNHRRTSPPDFSTSTTSAHPFGTSERQYARDTLDFNKTNAEVLRTAMEVCMPPTGSGTHDGGQQPGAVAADPPFVHRRSSSAARGSRSSSLRWSLSFGNVAANRRRVHETGGATAALASSFRKSSSSSFMGSPIHKSDANDNDSGRAAELLTANWAA